jgi:hypothetical protein
MTFLYVTDVNQKGVRAYSTSTHSSATGSPFALISACALLIITFATGYYILSCSVPYSGEVTPQIALAPLSKVLVSTNSLGTPIINPDIVSFHANVHFGLYFMLLGWLLTSIVILSSFATARYEKWVSVQLSNHPRLLRYLQGFMTMRNYLFYWFAFMVVPELSLALYAVHMLLNNPIVPTF